MPEQSMTVVRRVDGSDAAVVARLVDALLVELSGSSSRYEERLATAHRLLAEGDRIIGFLVVEEQHPLAVIMISESASIYAGGAFGVITALYVIPAKRSAGIAKLLVDATIALGRERSWSRVEMGAPHQPAWDRSLKFYLAMDLSRSVHDFNSCRERRPEPQ
jgi:GNAT superfamily N-acetyltransferase